MIIFIVVIHVLAAVIDGFTVHVCKKESVILFPDTAINPADEFSVTINHNGTTVGLWTNNETKCYRKICRDGNNDIRLNGFEESDSGLYALVYQRHMHGPREKEKERTFLVTIPPLPSCKPRFMYVPVDRVSGNLTAFLPEEGCGDPPVTVFWFRGPNQKFNKEDIANRSQGPFIHLRVNLLENPGVYIACIYGQGLRCVQDQFFTDFCNEFNVPEFKGEGPQFSTEQYIDRTNGTGWRDVIEILTFIAVIVHCCCFLTVHHEKILNIFQNIWSYWRPVHVNNVENNGRTKDNEDNQSFGSSSSIY
ncbi:hypothetical protein ACJMK2_017281 [Sinanodonta woodiana]